MDKIQEQKKKIEQQRHIQRRISRKNLLNRASRCWFKFILFLYRENEPWIESTCKKKNRATKPSPKKDQQEESFEQRFLRVACSCSIVFFKITNNQPRFPKLKKNWRTAQGLKKDQGNRE